METQSNNIDVLIELNNGAYAHKVTTRAGINVEVIDYADAQYVFDEEQRAKRIREAMSNPAPIDWAKEADRLFKMREKAIDYITEHTENSFFVYSGADIVYRQADGKRMITVGWDGEDSDEAEKEEVDDLDLAVLVDLCATIEKAIAGGAGR